MSQIQALDRTQPGLPLKKGRAGTMTHDYKRNGTTTLFAAMNVLDGTVIGRNMQRHRHQEFIRFLNAVEREVPAGKTIHAIIDNYAAHKHPTVRRWLARHPRWTFHFTPTSASWLNAVEGFFAILTKRRLKRGVFRSVADLEAAINRFLDDHNAHSKPFQWVADPDKIIAAVRRGHQALAGVLWSEGLYRSFSNRRQVAAYAGLAPTPWQSGSVAHEQGVSKAGNPRLRTTMIQLAWLWVRHQPSSILTPVVPSKGPVQWRPNPEGTDRCLGAKAAIAFWKYVTAGVVIWKVPRQRPLEPPALSLFNLPGPDQLRTIQVSGPRFGLA